MHLAGIKKCAFWQAKLIDFVVMKWPFRHLGPVLIEAYLIGCLIQQCEFPPQQLRQAGVNGWIAGEHWRASPICHWGDRHRRRRCTRLRFTAVAGLVGEQGSPQQRVFGAGHPAGGVIPEGIGPIAPHTARIHRQPGQAFPLHRLHRIAP